MNIQKRAVGIILILVGVVAVLSAIGFMYVTCGIREGRLRSKAYRFVSAKAPIIK